MLKISKFLIFKKAQEVDALKAIIGLILALMAMAALFYVVFLVVGLLSKSTQDLDSTVNNYKELTIIVEDMINDRAERIEIERFPLYIYQGYTIIGFDRFQNYIETYRESTIYKPSKCRNKACICLYHNAPFYSKDDFDDESLKDEGVIDCKIYKKPVKFFSKFRENDWGHPDIIGMERNDISTEDDWGDYEYFIATGYDKPLGIGGAFVHNEWKIQNLKLIKTISDNEIYFEISVIPDEETLRKEKIREEAIRLLEEFLDTDLPLLDDLLYPEVERYVAKEFIDEHLGIYEGTYEDLLIALYEYKDDNRIISVFKTVSVSMFYDDIPKDKDGNYVGSRIFIDYPPLTDSGITDDFSADLSFYGPTYPPDLVVSKIIELDNGEEAVVSFFISDINE